MIPRQKKTVLEKNIETAVKKLNIFTVSELEVLLKKPKLEIIPVLEKLVSRNIIRDNGDSYIYLPLQNKTKTKSRKEYDYESEHKMLPFQVKKFKEVHLKNINELDGFVDYFFAPPDVKNDIKNMFRILKETQGKSDNALKLALKKENITLAKYTRFKNEISKNGLVNLVGAKTKEPGEIYYFFKEYYLSPKQYSLAESRELAIQRFERLIKIKINRAKITTAKTMFRWVRKEFSKKQIEKLRNINFSKFDTEKIFKE